jgi:hypothetical protein
VLASSCAPAVGGGGLVVQCTRRRRAHIRAPLRGARTLARHKAAPCERKSCSDFILTPSDVFSYHLPATLIINQRLSSYLALRLGADIIRRVAVYPPFSCARISVAYLRLAAFCFTHSACPVVERPPKGGARVRAACGGTDTRPAFGWAAVALRCAGRNLTEKPRKRFSPFDAV